MSNFVNAKITDVMLGFEDHGLFTCMLYLDLSNGYSIGFGGYVLGGEQGIKFIQEILEVVGVDKWEQLKGQYIRVEDSEWNEPITAIGNLMEDKWLNAKEFFDECKRHE